MKIAGLLCGLPYDCEKTIQSQLEYLIEPNNIEMFVFSTEDEKTAKILEYYKPNIKYSKLIDDPNKDIKGRIREVYQYQKVRECFENISKKYDMVVRWRFDSLITKPIDIPSLNIGPEDIMMFVGHDYRGFETGLDGFAIGCYDVMDIYTNFFNVGRYYRVKKNMVYGRKWLADTEHRMLAHLHHNNINVKSLSFKVPGLQMIYSSRPEVHTYDLKLLNQLTNRKDLLFIVDNPMGQSTENEYIVP